MPPTALPIQRWTKWASVFLVLALLVAAMWFLFKTESGATILHDPRKLGSEVQRMFRQYPLSSRAGYLTLYVSLAVLALPIWWLQLLAGVGFGLYEGSLWSLMGSTIGVTITTAWIRWIAADWFHEKIEARMERLKKLDETLGHNGLLFVMTVRLIPLLPFGLFNYALGLSRISYRDIILGTFLGAIPAILVHVGIGAQYFVWRDWGFDAAITSITLVLLLPLMLRYLKPEWFEKIGVE